MEKGWTDQELGALWLENDFEPVTTTHNTSNRYRLLILDGHNSHCMFCFVNFAHNHCIIVLCLPSYTTHKLQPCDVGVFGPLATSWKKGVTQASHNEIPITNQILLIYYHKAREVAFKSTTILSAFAQTGISPFNQDALSDDAFAPALNTTTQAVQPISAELAEILTPILDVPSQNPVIENLTTGSDHSIHSKSDSINILTTSTHINTNTTLPLPLPESEPIKPIFPEYKIKTPAPLAHTSSCQALWIQNNQLHTIIAKAATQLECDYTQLKLMDKENECLRQVAFVKMQVKGKKKETTVHACLMTADANWEALALYEWTVIYKAVLKSVKAILKEHVDDIDKHYADLEKEVKRVVNEEKARQWAAKKVEEEALKADIAHQKLEEREAKAHEKAEEKARADEDKQGVCKEKAAEKAAADEEKQWVHEEKVAEKAKANGKKQWAREEKAAEKDAAGGGCGCGQAQGAGHGWAQGTGCGRGCGGAAVGKVSDDQDGSTSDLDLDSDMTHHSDSGTPPQPSSPASCIDSLNEDPTHPQLNVTGDETMEGSSIVAEGTLAAVIPGPSTEVAGSPAPAPTLEPQTASCHHTLHHGTCQCWALSDGGLLQLTDWQLKCDVFVIAGQLPSLDTFLDFYLKNIHGDVAWHSKILSSTLIDSQYAVLSYI